MKLTHINEQKKRLVIFYGSQTGTAEEYAIRLAKEAKSRFGIASLVCDPEEYEFENLDAIPDDCAVVFVMATYGEGEPTDNAVQLMQNLEDNDFPFSKGEHRLDGLKYVVFGLGNRTYEHYNLIARKVDDKLTELGAVRLGPRGEGDDDKAMEEDYLEWKEKMWPELAAALNVEEGQGGDTPDFVVTEDTPYPPEKVYLGELSARALTKTRGIHDAKNPFPASITVARELFTHGHERNCVHMELKIEGSGINYQHGDHVGVWPTNPEVEVDRLLAALGLWDKRDTVINIVSLDPALAKVPFPVPTTYGTVLRHYIDISAVASRQVLGIVSKFAPSEGAQTNLQTLATDKQKYHEVVAEGCLRFGQVLQLVCGNNVTAAPCPENTTAWSIPFETIVSCIPRLQPRYYSISSSPKYAPGSIHVTAVVLKYQSKAVAGAPMRWVYGVGSNMLHNLRFMASGETAPLVAEDPASPQLAAVPHYHTHGPRGAYLEETTYKVPIHVRRSTFRLPTNPRCPVIMIGPGTVSIPDMLCVYSLQF
jgi:NADPH-ferrihemoprotein reductase